MSSVVRKVVSWPKVLLFGDSITQFSFSTDGCWGSLLSDFLQRRCDVLNRGFSGYNTRWCKFLLPAILDEKLAKETVAVVIFLGANDSCCHELNPKQHVPLDEYKLNLKEMVEFSLSQGVNREKIILVTPPAFDAPAWGEQCRLKGKVLSKDNNMTGVYAQACSSVAGDMGTECVDLYSEMMKSESLSWLRNLLIIPFRGFCLVPLSSIPYIFASEYASYLCDGLHLSQHGSRLLFDLLRPIIAKLTAQLPVALFPFWDEVDLENVEKSLLGL